MARVTVHDRDRSTWRLYESSSTDASEGAGRQARVLVALAGAALEPERLLAEAARAGAVIAADGGATACLAAGLEPEAVVGDFDSLDDSILKRLDPSRLLSSTDPETNDLEKALAYLAIRRPVTEEIVLVGAGLVAGGRVDHTLANLGVLLAEPHRRIVSVDGEGRLLALRHGKVVLEDLAGVRLSVLPWTLHGVQVSETGVRYPLDRATLRLGGRGVSNEITAARAEVEIHEGVALVWIGV